MTRWIVRAGAVTLLWALWECLPYLLRVERGLLGVAVFLIVTAVSFMAWCMLFASFVLPMGRKLAMRRAQKGEAKAGA